ncbi:nadh-ubiquinone oxidoreductase b18 [Ceraceosorus bombacis]|uniref:NADH dehydrogenase [ubiquinone] 1 beta subcomplex subunit 7 n=1 Tax=Ceraceosorus bombacis TaxID=401625 RepID=A0A0P1BH52_9BASI|nr:nadh-ubiquinone oxidoreductase b18 [Ceraceosorus bombacis]
MSNAASHEEASKAHLPIQWRDQCGGLLISLNKCRRKESYLPWKCEHEKHTYEACQYDDFIRRQKLLSKQVLAKRDEAAI